MKSIYNYLLTYFRSLNSVVIIITLLLAACLVAVNFTLGIERSIMSLPYLQRFLGFLLLYALPFLIVHLAQLFITRKPLPAQKSFYYLLVLCPAVFAAKVSFDWFTKYAVSSLQYPWSRYWYLVLNWPFKCILVSVLVVLIWKWQRMSKPVAGLLFKGFNARPYFILLLFMMPLIILAATRADFLHTYPKFQRIAFMDSAVTDSSGYRLLYEIAYGIDFFTIEFFFRGLLVLLFARFVQKDAILPMAIFYCTIHFGKPLFECITSFFGGLILGAIVYNTRSIWGGLIVHLGIAWMMELAGYAGHLLFY